MELDEKKTAMALGAFFSAVLFLSAAMPAPPAPELQVKAFRIFGTGKADSSADAINPPDGLAFTKEGLLVATDAVNHRIQIFDPRAGKHLGHVGDAGLIAGMIVNVILLPDDRLLVSDETANQAYCFEKAAAAEAGYRLSGKPLFKADGFTKLNGLACDSKKRIYAVNGKKGYVRRCLPDFKPDPAWKFRPDKPVINRTEGIAIDEQSGTLFLTGEWEGMIHAFNLATGEWLGKTIGRQADAFGNPLGQSVFQRSVEGLAVMDDYLLAVDEGSDELSTSGTGHLLIFDLRSPALYDTGLEACRARMASGAAKGLVGWFGSYRSSDAVAVFAGDKNIEAMVAVADQGAYRVLVYYWKDIKEAIRNAKVPVD